MRISSSIRLVVAAIILDGSLVDAPTAAAAQVKPLIKVVAGYGSTDGAIAPLWFAKETGLFEKRGLDVRLVGMGTGAVSLRALIARDLELASLSGSGLVQAALQGADTVIISAAINGFVFKVFGAPEIARPAQLIHHLPEDPDRSVVVRLPQAIEQRLEGPFKAHRIGHAVEHELTKRVGDVNELNLGSGARPRFYGLVGARPRNHHRGLVMTDRMREEFCDCGLQVQFAVVELCGMNSGA